MNFGVVVFPGTWSDCDFHYVISEVLHQPVRYVWHRDANLADFGTIELHGLAQVGGGPTVGVGDASIHNMLEVIATPGGERYGRLRTSAVRNNQNSLSFIYIP